MPRPTPRSFTKWNARSSSHGFNINVVWFCRIKKHSETFVRNDVCSGFGTKSASATEVIWVTMRHDDGMHSLERHTDLGKPTIDCSPCCLAGQTRVNNSDSTRVFENIHIDVAKTRHVDRELGAQYVWRNFGDLCSCRHLLLFGVDLFAHTCTQA